MPRPPQRKDLRLLSKVSRSYYEQGLNQQEIADRLRVSRSKVSRMLQQARDVGVVQITVLSPPSIYPDLEYRLESRFGLQEAIVVEVTAPASQEAVSREVGPAGADYLQRTLAAGDVIGVTWGSTLNAMVSALQPQVAHDVQVVQMLGGLGPPEAEVHATDLCRRMARALKGGLTLLPAPGIVDSQQVKEAILSDSHVQRAMDLIPQISVAYVGIGAPTPTSVVVRDGSIAGQAELDDLLNRGAVGDIALRFFDAEGRPIHSGLDARVIGITLEQLKGIDRAVGVAGGPEKAAAIRGALLGGLVNVLITDYATAARLLQCPAETAEGALL
ncbi:MAG: sugar-binding transcriptional regulator [Anaerolineae bacterium]|nr:MAG: sugar-binding transcriptional regulator [Anaerolineae bacterium]